MISQVAVSQFQSLLLYVTSGDYPLLTQFIVMNLLLLAYAMVFRIRRKAVKYKTSKSPIPALVILVNSLTIVGFMTPVFKAIAGFVA